MTLTLPKKSWMNRVEQLVIKKLTLDQALWEFKVVPKQVGDQVVNSLGPYEQTFGVK